ncbi:MAG: MBL fold metallo-hydrolase [Planctomycetota bacterium]
MLRLGQFEIHTVPSGDFALDGGAMFGVVPQPLWARTNPPDEKNRIDLGMRLMLVKDGERTWLVDTGIGDKWSDKQNGIYRLENALLPDEAVRAAGHDPASITDVVLTHLHFDHGGGSTRADGTPVFEQARYHLQRAQFEWARDPAPKDRASYRPLDFMPLFEQDRLVLHDGRIEVADGIELLVVDGHTPGQQLVKIEGDGQTLLYTADLVPTATHLRTPYVMAYDNEPLKTIAEKVEWLGRAADEEWILFFEHDAHTTACRVRRGEKDFERGEEVAI